MLFWLQGPSSSVKVTLVGNEAVGKTSLCTAFAGGVFAEAPRNVICDRYTREIEVRGSTRMRLELQDTAGHGEYVRMRPLAYLGTGAFMMCFALDQAESLGNIEEQWMHEVEYFKVRAPIVLVGCKADLRSQDEAVGKLVTHGEATSVAQRIGAKAYKECSVKTGEGVQEVFETAAFQALETQRLRSVIRRVTSTCVVA